MSCLPAQKQSPIAPTLFMCRLHSCVDLNLSCLSLWAVVQNCYPTSLPVSFEICVHGSVLLLELRKNVEKFSFSSLRFIRTCRQGWPSETWSLRVRLNSLSTTNPTSVPQNAHFLHKKARLPSETETLLPSSVDV